jgi:hypothetical protein
MPRKAATTAEALKFSPSKLARMSNQLRVGDSPELPDDALGHRKILGRFGTGHTGMHIRHEAEGGLGKDQRYGDDQVKTIRASLFDVDDETARARQHTHEHQWQ